MTKKLRSRKRTTRTNSLRKNKTSRRTRKGETSRRTRKGKTSRRTRKGKTSRRRTRRRTRRINKNKEYSGGYLTPVVFQPRKKSNCGRMSGETRLEAYPLAHNFCMKKPASTIINNAKIPVDILEKYILQPFNLDDLEDGPAVTYEELARNFYRIIVGKTFYISQRPQDSPVVPFNTASHLDEGLFTSLVGNNTTLEQAQTLITELGAQLNEIYPDKKDKISEKIMRSVDTTGAKIVWYFPMMSIDYGVPSIGQTKMVCMVADGYVVQFVYYYMALGETTLQGPRPDKKYSGFVVRGYTKNLYFDGNDEKSGTIQIFPTDKTDIDEIITDDEDFRQHLLINYPDSDEYGVDQKTETTYILDNQIIEDMVEFIKRGKNFATWAIESTWASDTGGEKDENGAPIRAQGGKWRELWEKATEIDKPVSPPGSPEISKGSESVAGIELVAGVEDDV